MYLFQQCKIVSGFADKKLLKLETFYFMDGWMDAGHPGVLCSGGGARSSGGGGGGSCK